MNDTKELGYASMRIHNYTKHGEVFVATVNVYPIFDSKSKDTGEPVLTHFGTVLVDTVSLEENNYVNEGTLDVESNSSADTTTPQSLFFEAKYVMSSEVRNKKFLFRLIKIVL